MSNFSRRDFLAASLAATGSTFSLSEWSFANNEETSANPNLHLAPFRFDVSPPKGHSLCGGWIKPVVGYDDSLEAIGYVLLGAGKPIVVCAVDWTGLLNDAHIAWRKALADAAGTTIDRVAVQCVHQHNAPFACLNTEQIVLEQGDLPHVIELDFFNSCLERARKAVAAALPKAEAVTHIAHSQSKVEKVASNRRIDRDKNGKIKRMRGSSCKDESLRSMTEGIIDPWLKTIAFYNKDKKLVSCHYYATHPMSYYGDGRVSSDFTGIARKQRQEEEPGCTHIYFTGCAGNVSAGKYNDGSHEMRKILARRIYDGMIASEKQLKPEPIGQVSWKSHDILPPVRNTYQAAELKKRISNKANRVVNRNRPSFTLAWLERVEKKVPITLSSLQMNDIKTLHLPAESFIEYQLRAQSMQPDQFIATAAYGDGGPWYIPIAEEYPAGGYEVSVAFCDPKVDTIMTQGMKFLLS
ncbi:hypothetical protein [Gimesia aquarii]|uniref:Neutral/alkaline non-lysosomal ceramidase n=1 Tax=Gimesia aquarii TaxID=2527964 RepID=A0A517X3U3_9PLAN|nr:hypothetical protein [Gimesia aquarii]QDU12174.1 hypothetical protein V202x_55990 [Gimesia aquarii]